MSMLQVKVKSRMVEGTEQFNGTVEIPGLKATKVARKSDGQTEFGSRSALVTTARSVARSLGYEGIETDISSKSPSRVKTAAKGAAKSKSCSKKKTKKCS